MRDVAYIAHYFKLAIYVRLFEVYDGVMADSPIYYLNGEVSMEDLITVYSTPPELR